MSPSFVHSEPLDSTDLSRSQFILKNPQIRTITIPKPRPECNPNRIKPPSRRHISIARTLTGRARRCVNCEAIPGEWLPTCARHAHSSQVTSKVESAHNQSGRSRAAGQGATECGGDCCFGVGSRNGSRISGKVDCSATLCSAH